MNERLESEEIWASEHSDKQVYANYKNKIDKIVKQTQNPAPLLEK